jgi:hypothetical protein
MRRVRLLAAAGITIGLAIAALPSLASALPAGPARPASPAASAPAGLIAHRVRGCGPGVTVYTPRRPGTQPSAKALGLPAGRGSILAAATRWHARWMSTLTCESGPAGLVTSPSRATSALGLLNWSGYRDTTPSPNFVTASWRVPKVCCSFEGNNGSVIWPGIGDATVRNTSLIQDGTAQNVSSRNRASYFFWFEAVPETAIKRVTSIVPRPGDKVMVSAGYQTQVAHKASYVLCDGRLRRCVSFVLKSRRPDNKVEWIAERQEVCRSGHEWFPPMADFVHPELSITDGRYDVNGSGKPAFPISHGHPQRIFMAAGGVRIATPRGLRSRGTAFTDLQNSPGTWYELKNNGRPIPC